MQIYNRKEKQMENIEQFGSGALTFLYENAFGRILLKIVVLPVVSKIYGLYQGSRFSKKKIAPFIAEYGIKMDEYEPCEYASFQDFFTRQIKKECRPIAMEENALIAPADSKLSVYPIGELVSVKGVEYTVEELLGGRCDVKNFEGGLCLVFRLTMDDYHHYVFGDCGTVSAQYPIKGKLHTVSPISKAHKVYRNNSRHVSILQTKNFGEMICVEVGALLVGKIINKPVTSFEKGQEKGFFRLGGSTIVWLMQADCVELDADIMEYTKQGIEVKVQLGEQIGVKQLC